MDGAPVRQANSLGFLLGCKVVFCALFPRRKAEGCGGQDFGDGGHKINSLSLNVQREVDTQ